MTQICRESSSRRLDSAPEVLRDLVEILHDTLPDGLGTLAGRQLVQLGSFQDVALLGHSNRIPTSTRRGGRTTQGIVVLPERATVLERT